MRIRAVRERAGSYLEGPSPAASTFICDTPLAPASRRLNGHSQGHMTVVPSSIEIKRFQRPGHPAGS